MMELELPNEGGCTAKLPARELERLLAGMGWGSDPRVLVGLETGDDAGVYLLSEELGLVLTTDFFPPFCRDPFLYGEVAAVNALSDVYAMGGTPLAALNITMYPSGGDIAPLRTILEGGLAAARRAGIPIIGGHTIANDTPVYGMAVLGRVDPGRMCTNAGLRPGMSLVLTKPIGTGVAMAAERLGLCPPETYRVAVESMRQLNRAAATVAGELGAAACTDITGFSLLGHAHRMAAASRAGIHLRVADVPFIPGAADLARMGCVPGATFRNAEYLQGQWEAGAGLAVHLRHLLLDPQTSGGLLFAVEPEKATLAVARLRAEGYAFAGIVGHTVERQGLRVE
ncbi:MAG: selenide, water dikinase SelD [Bacteroidia bacterium]|nr:MAG: selenide, water dikinase SelD [Bacteroidia bacterium]